VPLRLALLSTLLTAALALPGLAQEKVKLTDNTLYQAALRALQGEQPGIAAQRLNELLASLKKDDPNRPEIIIRMGEAHVRDDDAGMAIEILSDPAVAKLDEAIYWTAAAQVSSGRLKDAADSLALLADSKDPHLKNLAAIGRARLLASLGNLTEAAAVLVTVEASGEAKPVQEARLLRSSLLLEEEKMEEATALLQTVDADIPSLQKRKIYLQARLAMAAGDFALAEQNFERLINDPTHLTEALYRSTVLGRGDVLHELEKDSEAVNLLLNYIESQPDNPFLDPFFSRLLGWSASTPALRSLLKTRLATWAAESAPPQGFLLGAASMPTPATRSNLGAYALFHYALLLAEQNDPDSVAQARSLLNHLRLGYPTHPLFSLSLLETGRLFLAEKKPKRSLAALAALAAVAKSPALQSSAAELTARVEFAQGDFAEAAGAFARARANLQADDNHYTAVNHGLSLLEAAADSEFEGLLSSLEGTEAARTLALEQAIVLATRKDPRAPALLDSYLRQYPDDSPRIVEARLALAEISLAIEPRDLSMTLAQLDSIETSKLSQPFALRHLLARLRLAELVGDWDSAISEATAYLRAHDTPTDSGVLLKLGEAYYLSGLYNQSRIQFLLAAEQSANVTQKEVARFYAAKAALQVGTEEARNGAIGLFEEVAKSESLLSVDARLHLARAQLDATNPEDAIRTLAPLSDNADIGQPHIDALLLLAEAYRISGEADDLDQCLEVYDTLLKRDDLDYSFNSRVHFLKGLTLEQMRRPGDALDSYYRVINVRNLEEGKPIKAWKWYYDCGFRALSLLEEGKRWRSAFGVARTLAESGGPRAAEAAKRAQALQLGHMIWSDE